MALSWLGRRGSGGNRVVTQEAPPAHHNSTSTPPPPPSLRDPGRRFTIVTTASLPWMTGTSVNPLLRAAYLAHRGDRCRVTLVVPWLAPCDQKLVHPNAIFDNPEQQRAHIRQWLMGRVDFEPTFDIHFYPGRYAIDKGSIVPVGDVTECVPEEEADVAVLEEPEHLTWFHHGVRWSDKFRHVVGIIHTNYLEYARREQNGERKEALLRNVNHAVARMHCHKIIKLSDAVQDFARSVTVNVHGVSPHFIEVGRKVAQAAEERGRHGLASGGGTTAGGGPGSSSSSSSDSTSSSNSRIFTKGGYFIGKVLWAKGYLELLERVKEYNAAAAPKDRLELDVFGDGDDFKDVKATAERGGLPLTFHGRADHAGEASRGYKFFINPSLSDVLATTTAEALAMGKFVVCAHHPSNAFFSTFSNCRTYSTPAEFAERIREVLHSEPEPIPPEDLHRLTWQAATERFLDAAEPHMEEICLPGSGGHHGWRIFKAHVEAVNDWFSVQLHKWLTASEALRCLVGAGAGTLVAPRGDRALAAWRPDLWSGGVMDRK
eukprot:CAMPEP_0197585326 /NCGR_PEP_ID=MMETSP1326-20131121/7652_1 /TAXON_ID=1155430 /ORGANISM="Genus nov. species nov., Strain RCC2288" /LENGTH=544 /DNA_ID=CAMNT_0043149813 /DNA_START=172 /DNA_END=1806 /DNA_ORIENTATION=+